MTTRRIFLAASFAFLWSTCLVGQTRPIRQIKIVSVWEGWEHSIKTQLFIFSRRDAYWSGNKPVDAKLVNALVSALNEAAIANPNLQNLGLTKEWLEAAVLSIPGIPVEPGLEGKEREFRNAFTDLDFVQSLLPMLFGFEQTDDYPSAKVVVTFADGSTIAALSHSYYVFMLPWRLGTGESSVRTYNANISRAVAALMEEGATNRERLQGARLGTELADAVSSRLRSQHP